MLIDTYSRRIFNLAYQFTGSYETSEDLTQEIFIKVYNSLHKYDCSRNFSSWITTLSRNYLIDHYRKTKLEKKKRTDFNEHMLDSEGKTDPEKTIIKKQNQKIIWEKSAGGVLYSTPAVTGGRVYAGGENGHLYVFDANTGEQLQDLTIGGEIKTVPAIYGSSIYLSSGDGNLYKVN